MNEPKEPQVKSFRDFSIKPRTDGFVGDKIDINKVLNTEIIVERFSVEPSKKNDGSDCLYLQIRFQGAARVVFIGSKNLIEMIRNVPANGFPFKTTIVKENMRLEFT